MQIRSRNQLGSLLNSLGLLGHGVEIGVQAGEYSKIIRLTWKGKYLHLVDRWRSDPDYKDIANISDEEHEKLYKHVVNTFSDDGGVFVHKMDSSSAAQKFEDKFFDWVYIDADHSYEGCKADLETWYPKLKEGGVFSGHDFLDGTYNAGVFGVKSAVEEFIQDKNVELYVTNSDYCNSWYFIKPHIKQDDEYNAMESLANNRNLIKNSANKSKGDTMDSFNELFIIAYNNFSDGLIEQAIENLYNAERRYSAHDDNQFNLEDLYILRATVYFSRNRYEEARMDFEKALGENPNSSQACLGLGKYFYATGQNENAKIMVEWAVKYNPENKDAVKALAEINSVLGLSEDDSSLNKKEGTSGDYSRYIEEASSLFMEKKYGEAIDKLTYAKKEQEAVLASIENFLAFNFLGLNEYNKAKGCAERALNINPESSQAYAILGEISFVHNDIRTAKDNFEKALRLNPENDFALNGMQKVQNVNKNSFNYAVR